MVEIINLGNQEISNLIETDEFKETYKFLGLIANNYLGNVHHICTNDYLKRDGVILWTDHGLFHTSNVLENIVKLLTLIDELSDYEKFLLLASGVVHDFGMFVRLVEGDLITQRRYHGRLAEIILGNLLTDENFRGRLNLDLMDVWYIGTIARLHQTKEFKNFVSSMNHSDLKDEKPNPCADILPSSPRASLTYSKIARLGGILLLADGFDIVKGRANHNIFKAFQEIIGQVNPLSSAEWLTNSLVERYEIVTQEDGVIKATYYIKVATVNKELQLALDAEDDDFSQNVAEYFMSFLWRYLYDGHFRHFGELFPETKLKVELKDFVNNELLTQMEEGSTSGKQPYNKEWQFWYEGLANLNLGQELWTELIELTRLFDCDYCFILVKDNLRSALRILVPADFTKEYANSQYIKDVSRYSPLNEYPRSVDESEVFSKFREDCLSARVPEKFSVAGHVWYRGLPEIVDFGQAKGGRMMSENLDMSLGLRGLYYQPVISNNETDDERVLHFILVFNREKGHSDRIKPILKQHCTHAWRSYVRGRIEGALPEDLNEKMHHVSDKLKERLFLGHPMEVKL